jgi:hypothetical protein
MESSGMLFRVAVARTDVLEERIAYIIRVTRIGGRVFLRRMLRLLVTANVVPRSPFLVTLMMEAIHSSETSVLTRATRRHSQKRAFFLNLLGSARSTQYIRICLKMGKPRKPGKRRQPHDLLDKYRL